MRQGYKVIDTDTHVTPSIEVLMRYADDELKARADELVQYTRVTKPVAGRGHPTEDYGVVRVNPYPYERMAGRKYGETEEPAGAGARGALEGRTENEATRSVHTRIQHDNPEGRLLDMDVEGVDIDLIIPGTWAPGSSALDVDLAKSMHRAYHRYMTDYTNADPRRLKGIILADTRDPKGTAKEIEELAAHDWVAGVWPVLPEGLPIDDPDLSPIFAAMNEANLPIVHHSFFYEAPYFPGYRDVWGNAAFARTAAHVWGAQRLLGYVLISGMLDRFPNLRVGCVETGHGWLANFIIRLDKQIKFVKGGTVPPELQHTPLEFVEMGRVFCAIEAFEGPVMTKGVIDVLGEDVLMFESDFPHPECMFPETTDHIIGWKSILGESATRKLMGENAMKFLRLTTTPWDDEAKPSTTTMPLVD
ncbi:MAG TPA: amidohydrolase family protein [Ilumatobacteraceae bacterium]|nr:amidohydrolase family protein [Ilumatobacteraceae bacterium]